jgi:hypothetical protein
MALATVLVAVLAAFRSPGWRVSATCAAAAAFLFGITSIVNPGIPASGGRVWGAAVIVWSLALMGAAAREEASECRDGSDGTRTRDSGVTVHPPRLPSCR